ncbi:hypothetical protein VPH35_069033 [Triticum aestivum]|uniref:FBD-associated F-box protein At4g10400-like n=1 Tax=Triticum aestivum TaxID=4565 RepID=UPI001D025DBB|nr:FBD-associated F-box protein At4g10400-like [Triticum aestivum]
MAPRKYKKAPRSTAVDRIGDLPDEIVHHILSFLPAQEAVRTSVLARRWRHLWRSATGLRIVGIEGADTVQELRQFVDHLLILRGHAELHTFEIGISEFSQEDVPLFLNLYEPPLVSRHLRALDLEGVRLQGAFLDFTSCPALEDLKMKQSHIYLEKIVSRSLQRLSIIGCSSDMYYRISISTPCLISFTLDGFQDKTPLLESTPLLETAFVRLGCDYYDTCHNYEDGLFCGANDSSCPNCLAYNDGMSKTVLLGALYNAKHLELISTSEMFIFARDLKWCPTFNKLKTLLLNEYWCVGPDFDALTCILKHSPVLEKLTLQLVSEGQQAHKWK